MRLLHVCPGNLYGGIERMLVTLARHHAAAPELVQAFCLNYAGRFESELRDAAATVHTIRAPRFSRPWTVFSARRTFTTLLRESKPDVVAMHGVWPHAIYGPVVRRTAGARLVLWLHDPPPDEGPLPWLDRLASRCRPDLVVANSTYTSARVGRLYPTNVRRVVIRPAVELPTIDRSVRDRIRLERGVHDDEVVILQVGRWQRHKGHLQLLDALATLKDMPAWRCWQVGAPQRDFEKEYLEEVKAACERLGLQSRVEFLGWVPNVNDLYAAADVYCQPNAGPEPFGIALVEAMGSGLPVVTSACGGPMEIIAEATEIGAGAAGILVQPNDRDALSDALRQLIVDGDARAKLAAGGRRRAAELCDPASRLRELCDVLGSIQS